MINFYLLTIDGNAEIDMKVLETKLDMALDWVKILPNVYLLKSSSELSKWKVRFATVLHRKKYFLVEICPNNRKGFLNTYIWDWISMNAKDI